MTMRGKVAVAGVGETAYYKHGQTPYPEFKLTLTAILAACENAGISPREIDGFSSYSADRNDPVRLAAALGLSDVGLSCMQWQGGGGGAAAAVANAAAGIVSGQANCVVVHRGLAQGEFGRFGQFNLFYGVPGDIAHTAPYGVLAPPQVFAMRAMRFMHDHSVRQDALRAIALASYHHAQSNPRALMRGRPLDEAKYDSSRWIAEPYHLYDCCMENDGAAAMILVSADRARDLPNPPCYLLAGGCGIGYRDGAWVHNAPDYGASGFATLAGRLYAMAGIGPGDVDTVQVYENFTGGVVMALVEFGFCTADEVNAFVTKDNLIVGGRLPLNTSGGNLAECYMHGMGLLIEGVRQIYRQSTAQVHDADVSLVTGGPMAPPVSACLFGSERVL